jgi:hypothetical protein
VFGLVLLTTTARGRILGAMAMAVGTATVGAGVLFAVGGYSPTAMLASMTSGVLWILWTIMIGLWAWHLAPTQVAAQ